jgi:Domain of unknown function (DUF4440)
VEEFGEGNFSLPAIWPASAQISGPVMLCIALFGGTYLRKPTQRSRQPKKRRDVLVIYSGSVQDSDEIKALEDRRYRAMLAGDTAALDELCSDDLIYTHSKADHDDKASYLHKVGTRYFTYLEITHPADRILVVEGAALVTGRMTAKVLGGGHDRAC